MTAALYTERLELRPFTLQDVGWVVEALDDIDVARWIPFLPYPYRAKDAEAFIKQQSGASADALAVVHGGKGIGCITTSVELGYWFAQPAWGKGLATESARAITTRHFEAGYGQLDSGYMLDNKRSLGVLHKLGFKPTEVVTRRSVALKADVCVQRMVLLRQDWQARQ